MKIEKLWFADNRLYVKDEEGKTHYQSLYFYPRLLNATPQQKEKFELWEYGIRWDEIDEDVSYESFSYPENKVPSKGIPALFLMHPELNQSAVARRMGIQQSLLASYIRGGKVPSKERKQLILETIHQIGRELCEVTL